MNNFTRTCTSAPLANVRKAASSVGIEYVTLDTKENRLKVCNELSLHVQNVFNKEGINPIVKDLLYKQEKDCGCGAK